ncbi:MAG: glycosyltransferase family 39 protein [Candidatus Moranbacteria bacterium]|nr:glycosyltransferase family 39 protein [Candidatus Moranbacteria bacterium]
MHTSDILSYFKKYGWVIALIAICVLGSWMRLTRYADTLVIKSDQARDVLIVSRAMQAGFDSLPLLGPQVGGTDLRLGPIFYYFQYVSGKLFGGRTESFSYPDLLFGILTLPLLFLLLRRFFTRPLSLWLAALGSVSFLLITFSRFGWNPNSLPFFTTLFAWSFLKALDHTDVRKRLCFITLSAISTGIIAQLHLAAILGLGIGLGLFIILFRPLRYKEVLLFIAIVLALHTPMMLSEYRTGGENSQAFIQAATKKGSEDTGHAWYEKTFRAYQQNAGATWLILTGQQNTDTILTKGRLIKCDKGCKAALPYSLLAMALLGSILVAGYLSWKSAESPERKQALSFIMLWMIGFLLLTIPLAYQLETRFFLSIIPPLFILIGLTVQRISNRLAGKTAKALLMFGGIAILLLQFHTSTAYIRELTRSQTSAQESSRDLRFGTAPKVTLGQLRSIAQESSRHFAPNEPVIVTGESLYAKAMYYVLSSEFDHPGCYLKGDNDIPSSFNRLIIEYAPDDKTPVTFGTLSAAFTPAIPSKTAAPLPKGCLTY